MRDLDILMDSKLKFHMHTDSVVNKAYRVLGLINKSFECKDPDIVLKLYKSLVRPIVEYANVIWAPHYILDQQKVERIQRKATRIIPSFHGSTYNDRMRILSLPSLQYQRRRGDLIFLYQILGNFYNIDKNKFFSPTFLSTRGHNRKIFKPHSRCVPRTSFFAIRVINDWNSLPQSVVDAPCINGFKKLLDSHFCNSQYDFV